MTSSSWQAGGVEPTVLRGWGDLLGLVTGDLVGSDGSTRAVSIDPLPPLYVLRGRARAARGGGVHDEESGCVLPGLPVLQLSPATWWPGQVADWVSRQLSSHARDQGQGVSVPVLTGRTVARGWDGEPLLADVRVVAVVPPTLVAHAQRHHRSLASGRWPTAAGR